MKINNTLREKADAIIFAGCAAVGALLYLEYDLNVSYGQDWITVRFILVVVMALVMYTYNLSKEYYLGEIGKLVDMNEKLRAPENGEEEPEPPEPDAHNKFSKK